MSINRARWGDDSARRWFRVTKIAGKGLRSPEVGYEWAAEADHGRAWTRTNDYPPLYSVDRMETRLFTPALGNRCCDCTWHMCIVRLD